MNRIYIMLTILIVSCLMAGSALSQNDPIGEIDTVTVVVEPLDAGSWVVTTHVWNDEEIGGVGIPLKYSAGVATLNFDSISYAGTRMETFAKQYHQVDTANQMVHFGGFPYMAPNQPPMPPGSGEMARFYISVVGDKKPGPFAVDTVTMKPNNSLMLVDRNAKSIKPALKIIYMEKGKKEEAEKKK